MITAQDIDDAIASALGNNPKLRDILTEFKSLRDWCRQRWMTGDEPQQWPDTLIEARKEHRGL